MDGMVTRIARFIGFDDDGEVVTFESRKPSKSKCSGYLSEFETEKES